MRTRDMWNICLQTHRKTERYKLANVLIRIQTSRVNNPIIGLKLQIFRVLFLSEHKHIGSFSNLHQYIFKPTSVRGGEYIKSHLKNLTKH